MSKILSLEELERMWSNYERPADGSIYRHYKGDIYRIVATGFLEDTETPCVIYKSEKLGLVWVRTTKNFLENIEYKGKVVQRFTKQQ